MLKVLVYDVVSEIFTEVFVSRMIVFLVVSQVLAHLQFRQQKLENVILAWWAAAGNVGFSEVICILYHLQPCFFVLLVELVEFFSLQVLDFQFGKSHGRFPPLRGNGYETDYGEYPRYG